MSAERDFNDNALNNVLAKCEQYWNEHGICDAEVHSMLEFIHREASKMEPLLAACRRYLDDNAACDCYDEYGHRRPNAPCDACKMAVELRRVQGTEKEI